MSAGNNQSGKKSSISGNPFSAAAATREVPDTDAPEQELSVADEIRANLKILSKGYRPEMATGMASIFDVTLFPQDYKEGGMLTPRWVNNDPGRLAIMRAKGYHFPQELSSRLPNRDLGSCVLMLQPREYTVQSKLAMREKIAQMDQQVGPTFSPEYNKFKDHVDHRHVSHTQAPISFEVDPKTHAVVTAD